MSAETEEQKERRRERDRARDATPERKAYMRELGRTRRAARTPEEKERDREYQREYRARPGEIARRREREKVRRIERIAERYGAPAEKSGQPGDCELCGDPVRSLKLDHDHNTCRFCGFICHPCNIGLGSFREDPLRLQLAIEYLKRTGKTPKL